MASCRQSVYRQYQVYIELNTKDLTCFIQHCQVIITTQILAYASNAACAAASRATGTRGAEQET